VVMLPMASEWKPVFITNKSFVKGT
jgi:hypothetical protein